MNIKLQLNNEINTKLENNTNLQEDTREIWSNINSSIDNNEEVLRNYYTNYSYISSSFVDAMFKMEDELFKKSGLKYGLYMIYKNEGDYENRSILPVINKNLADKFYVAKNMEEVNNEETINNCKQEIIKQYNKEIEQYAKMYKIDKEQVYNLKSNLPELVNKYFDRVADKLLNNNVRDKLEIYCDRLENAYDKGDFKKMTQITNELLKYLSKESTIYRDEDLFKRLRTDVTRSKMVQNNIEEGKAEKLSSIEEELLSKFDNEQMNIFKSDLKVNKHLSQDDVTIARFQMGTEIFKKIFAQ